MLCGGRKLRAEGLVAFPVSLQTGGKPEKMKEWKFTSTAKASRASYCEWLTHKWEQ